MEPFSPGTNVIVGRNGSGKSNFFAAIRFVLGDAYTQLSREERQALLHEGSGSAVMSAYVEIIFDNDENRFQTGNKEVSLRRTITLKKDEYAVDKKVSNRQEVMSMLDTAGFSLKNSYYIVPQGRVTALTNMKESDRLKLLKEVAGTESYEARRTESLKIMTETNNKREKIDELLDYIKNRMNELEEEKEELRGFQEKDRERRCLEYAYYHQQQVSFRDALEEIEQARLGSTTATDATEKAARDGQQILAQLEAKLAELNQSLEILRIEQRDHDEDRKAISKVQANAELKVKNLSDTQSAREQARRQNEEGLHNVKQDLGLRETQLATLTPDFEKRKAKEAKVKQTYDAAEVARRRLLSKQARGSQFRNKAERDESIGTDIAEINLTIQTLKANYVAANEAVGEVSKTMEVLESEISNTREELKGYSGKRNALAEQLNQAKDETQKLDDERKLLHREDDKLQSVIQTARRERDKAQNDLSRAMDNATARGIATIEALKQREDIPGAYGILADLMDVGKIYQVPVEQIAGNSLFHYVVDNERTGTLLSDHLHKTYGGRLTFMPLEQLRPRKVNLPNANDAMPLLSKIEYDPKYEKAFQQVFGKAVLCPTLAVASQYARSHNLTGITTDGDITSKQGAITGGYVDRSRSRLDALRTRNRWRAEYDRLCDQANEIRAQQDKKEQQITGARGQERRLEIQLRQYEDGYEPLRLEHSRKMEQLELERDRLDAAQRRREKLNSDMQEQITNVDSLEAERKSDFKKALTASEEQQLQELGRQVVELQKHLVDATHRRQETESHKMALEGELRNLRKTEDQLSSSNFEPASLSGAGGSYADAQKELKKIRKASDSIAKKLQKAGADIDEAMAKIADIESQMAQQRDAQHELDRTKDKHEKRMEKSRQQMVLLQQQLGECAKSIRDLGVLPEEAFEKYKRMDTGKVGQGSFAAYGRRRALTQRHRYPNGSSRSTRL